MKKTGIYYFSAFIIISLYLYLPSFYKKEKMKKQENAEIITRGAAAKIENKVYLDMEITENKIKKGDSLTIVPISNEFEEFNIEIENVERIHGCGVEGEKDYNVDIELESSRGWGLYGELEESFEFLVLKPKAKNATLLDSVGRELPDGFKESTVEAAVDTDSDGRADLLKFGLCCYRRAHPDSTSCRECTMAYRIQGDSLKRTYSSAPC